MKEWHVRRLEPRDHVASVLMRSAMARMRAERFHPELRRLSRLLPRTTVGRRTLGLVRRLNARAPHHPAFETIEVNATTHVRLCRPAAASAVPAGALLWCHGGGLVVGNAREFEQFFATVARDLQVMVASVEYRLAPEHAYPAALDDCYAALEWLAARDDVDPERIAVGGGSAGGNLAAAVALAVRDRGGPPLAYQVLLYPMLDDRTAARDDPDPTVRRLWDNRSNHFGWRAYLGQEPGTPGIDHLAAPARCPDLTGVADAWIGVGDLDLFHDEDLAFASALEAAGADVTTVVVPGAYHGFDIAAGTQVAKDFRRSWTDALRAAIC